MLFTVLQPGAIVVPTTPPGKAYLVRDGWNDWYEWYTMLTLFVIDQQGIKHSIGSVKIACFNMELRRVPLPDEFDQLPDTYFSLGQDENYYESLFALEEGLRQSIYSGLRDVAVDAALFERSKNELVMRRSLLRTVSELSATGRFRRLARGEANLTPFRFQFCLPETATDPPTIMFNVIPESTPPTNVHVIIGKNGVGKTRCMQLMILSLLAGKQNDSLGRFVSHNTDPAFGDAIIDNTQAFKNVVSVTFSAFDPFEPIESTNAEPLAISYSYIGLKSGAVPLSQSIEAVLHPGSTHQSVRPKDVDELVSDFSSSVRTCMMGVRAQRWKRALSILEADPMFKDAGITSLANGVDENSLDKISRQTFSTLSSGHKIVLLTITRLVETVEEKTIVFLDEPEAHLHPPLLSAFVRSLSDLLIQRNGVAIIATHSPVILQEVPKSCVSILWRTGSIVRVERAELETFGENVGILTQEVFGLEVTHSGFHQMLLNEAKSPDSDYDSILTKFKHQLGVEAKSILRGILANRGALISGRE